MDKEINKEKLLKSMTLMIFFVFILNSLALKFHWYSSVWWFDIPMHFMGGFWIGLAWIWLFVPSNLPNLPKKVGGWGKSILKIILGVLLIGVLWEIFEIIVNETITKNQFNYLDTFSDICFDLAGGFTALYYCLKRIVYTK
ncbi:MAG: hypothetical protein WAV23_03220 [Minisyncoccia bacterium]